MYVPWRRVASWHCDACGICCYRYRVRLTFYEYLKLRPTGLVEEKFGRYYIRKIGGRCPFQVGRLCSLQGVKKPAACKLFPFFVRRKGERDAFYEYNGEEFYVYISTDCPNVVLSRERRESKRVESLVREAVQLYTGEKRNVEFITAPTVV
ncbi:YkgJ family cysteine cluster protein [Archaeoglobus veneficus]|uniref:YkgJ family cysteine cluster protein n=1 Tax=Archaeoglobus veneficus (strain DSM 11195 / SNP6) TaxID=693661 RepID=F2KNC5_ARCVS|nr:YkgJ family cysteine cluster protein [Archaeoglobus veneficus]AEA47327.1 protein of unknown function UPF0153 [Archaeoglobus veneficus SNP6]